MGNKILVFDNYDSFTYNIVHALRQLGVVPDVARNDKISIEDLNRYDKIVLSPGPGVPSEAGLLMTLLKHYTPSKSILGICLGHQAIGQHFGASLRNLSKVYHGIQTPIEITTDDYLFKGLPKKIKVGRYHSWVVDTEGFPSALEITAKDDNGEIMALRHCSLDIRGVQFHPESILSPDGLAIINNWVSH